MLVQGASETGGRDVPTVCQLPLAPLPPKSESRGCRESCASRPGPLRPRLETPFPPSELTCVNCTSREQSPLRQRSTINNSRRRPTPSRGHHDLQDAHREARRRACRAWAQTACPGRCGQLYRWVRGGAQSAPALLPGPVCGEGMGWRWAGPVFGGSVLRHACCDGWAWCRWWRWAVRVLCVGARRRAAAMMRASLTTCVV